MYQFKLDDNDYLFPDMASRFQPEDRTARRSVVDHTRFTWTDANWRGCTLEGQVIYEMHIGTFTPEGTWRAAADQLEELRDLGITLLEIMPVAEFPGKFGWGYDGVYLFAPTRHTASRMTRALHRSGACSRTRRHPGCRLQPHRPGRQLSREFSKAYFSERTRTNGATRSTSTAQTRTACASS